MSKKRLFGYIAFGFFSLLVCLYLRFPAEAVAQRMAYEIQKATRGSVALSFKDVSMYRLTGFSAEDVTIEHTGRNDKKLTVQVDSFSARLQILPLLLLKTAIAGNVEIGDGEIDFDVTPGKANTAFDVRVDDLDLRSPPILPQMLGVPLAGVVSGSAEGDWQRDPKKTKAQASLTIRDTAVGPGSVSLGGGGFGSLELESGVPLGQLDTALKIDAGQASIPSFTQKGGQIALDVSADSTLRGSFAASTLNACIKVKPDAAFLKQNPKLEAMIELSQATLKKDGDDFLNIPLAGTVARPKARRGLCPAKGASRRRKP